MYYKRTCKCILFRALIMTIENDDSDWGEEEDDADDIDSIF